ncbi:FAM194 protein-domain-containing protein [Pelagophyceae sp. CCMP2097]|nr:FAM194 protein-domain-containing protein [Pelagophyceae sp. CCMP2097]|mmetsp:Transcript_12743/g.44010  ORF Transcript_12743/g.44010 Transcript_12743/m.44010 type:complete len:668 (+) Transcript_12743:128-2131(+)
MRPLSAASKRMDFGADGSGFAYYSSGRVACCVAGATAYSSRAYFYADDAKATLVCAVDEFAVGFAIAQDGARLVLSKKGALVADSRGDITHEWKWDRGAQGAGRPPAEPLVLELNRHLRLELHSRADVRVSLSLDGDGPDLKRDFDVGLKLRRSDNYLDGARRGNTGKLELSFDRMSLAARTTSAGGAAAEKRSRLKPNSATLTHPETRAVVAGLEADFDGYGKTHAAPREFGGAWRGRAAAATLGEVPRLGLTGLECGPVKGLGGTIYGAPIAAVDRPWEKTAFDLHVALMGANPLLPRSDVLCAASGRYADDIRVPGGKASAANPTGKTESCRLALRAVAPQDLPKYVSQKGGKLLCVACVRGDDAKSIRAEAVAEALNGAVSRGEVPRGDFELLKCDMSVSRAVTEKYGVRALPTFLMFFEGKIAYRGQLGGEAVRVAADVAARRALLVEPRFKDQAWSEKLLRRASVVADLCLSGADAAQKVQKARAQPGAAAFDYVFVSASCTPDDCAAVERGLRLSGGGRAAAFVVGLAELSGEAGAEAHSAAAWQGRRSALSPDVFFLLPPHVAAICDLAATKPLKANAVEDLADAGGGGAAAAARRGLTPQALHRQLLDALSLAKRGVFLADAAPQALPRGGFSARRKPRFDLPGPDVTLNSLIDRSLT